MHAYSDAAHSVIESHGRVHANSEQTHVSVLEVEDAFVAIAFDLSPGEYEPLEAECIAYGPTRRDAVERASRWMETNPKGIQHEESGPGVLFRLWRWMRDF